jgi:succinoglycan biosynthesis protein ExoL
MKIAYFVHDVTDPAVARRLGMLRATGAEVSVIGFRRSDTVVTELERAPVFDLGRTYDAQLRDRAGRVLDWMLNVERFKAWVQGAQVFMARNLEMLAVASAARRLTQSRPALVYECLDIHWLMLSRTPAGWFLRLAERRLLAQTRLLIVSSPAFLDRYFEPVQQIGRLGVKPLLIENKHLDLTAVRARRAWAPRRPGPPWRIGWFGCLRCRESLDILTALAARRPDLVEVVIRGRPAPAVFRDFADMVEGVPGMRYGGPYHPHEIAALYRDCHFSWAIDYYDEGRNSAILIPNRIYDAGAHHCVPLALADVETGSWLARRGVGVLLEDPLRELEAFFERLDAHGYRALEARMASVDPNAFRADRAECERLHSALAGLMAKPRFSDDSDSKAQRSPAPRRALSERGGEPAGVAR